MVGHYQRKCCLVTGHRRDNRGGLVDTPHVTITEAQTGFLGVVFEVLASGSVCKPLESCDSSMPQFYHNYIEVNITPIRDVWGEFCRKTKECNFLLNSVPVLTTGFS